MIEAREDFIQSYEVSDEHLTSCGMPWEELHAIARAHEHRRAELEAAGQFALLLLRELPEIHSLKVRVKDPAHLVRKVVRKLRDKRYAGVSATTYESHVTDLVGIRALHLFKDDWQSIHEHILRTWEVKEQPIAYYRQGDSPDVIQAFRDAGCNPTEHSAGYRSLHYVIVSKPSKRTEVVEIQVRTLFEEAWSEIDHHVRYPEQSQQPELAEFLTIFNRLAGSADEMGTFIKRLQSAFTVSAERIAAIETEKGQLSQQLKESVEKLQIGEAEKARIKNQIEQMQKTTMENVLAEVGATQVRNLHNTRAYFNTMLSLHSARRVCSKCQKEFRPLGMSNQTTCLQCSWSPQERGDAAADSEQS